MTACRAYVIGSACGGPRLCGSYAAPMRPYELGKRRVLRRGTRYGRGRVTCADGRSSEVYMSLGRTIAGMSDTRRRPRCGRIRRARSTATASRPSCRADRRPLPAVRAVPAVQVAGGHTRHGCRACRAACRVPRGAFPVAALPPLWCRCAVADETAVPSRLSPPSRSCPNTRVLRRGRRASYARGVGLADRAEVWAGGGAVALTARPNTHPCPGIRAGSRRCESAHHNPD